MQSWQVNLNGGKSATALVQQREQERAGREEERAEPPCQAVGADLCRRRSRRGAATTFNRPLKAHSNVAPASSFRVQGESDTSFSHTLLGRTKQASLCVPVYLFLFRAGSRNRLWHQHSPTDRPDDPLIDLPSTYLHSINYLLVLFRKLWQLLTINTDTSS